MCIDELFRIFQSAWNLATPLSHFDEHGTRTLHLKEIVERLLNGLSAEGVIIAQN